MKKFAKILGVLLLLGILGFGWLIWNFNRPPFDLARLQQLHPGMSQAEVRGILDRLRLRGDERILDLGCGRGAVLLMAAQHLTTGRAVGVDLWRSVDQSGNSAEATQRNAVAEGVADRVELHTGNMTALPFEDNSFDVIVSSLAIHNISGRAGRDKAISEAVRVLRPGGRLLILDVRSTGQYQAELAKLGMNDVARSRLGWWSWPARLVTATKPQPGN